MRLQKIARGLLRRFDHEPKLILLVEDQQLFRELTCYQLESRGYSVKTAASLEEAEAQLHAHKFELVLLDVRLPDGNGIRFIPTIRTLHPNLPVVVFTGMGYEEAAFQAAIRAGATRYLSKLLPADQMLRELHQILTKSKGQYSNRPSHI